MAKRLLFLDLEDTIITPVVNGWFNSHLINLEKIQAFINDWKPDELHVFSFAIHSEWELLRFKDHLQPYIERKLGYKLLTVPMTPEIQRICCNQLSMSTERVEFSDMSDFWGKHEAFRLYVRQLFSKAAEPVEVALLDDAVEDEDFHFPRLGISGQIRNIDVLPEPSGP